MLYEHEVLLFSYFFLKIPDYLHNSLTFQNDLSFIENVAALNVEFY